MQPIINLILQLFTTMVSIPMPLWLAILILAILISNLMKLVRKG